VRRIEAVAGEWAESLFAETFALRKILAKELHCRAEEVPDALATLREKMRNLERQLERREQADVQRQLEALRSRVRAMGGPIRLAEIVEAGDGAALRMMVRQLAQQFPDGMFLLARRLEEHWAFAVACGEGALGAGNSAERWAAALAERTGGRGGGKGDFASGTIPGQVEVSAILREP
jgi:alanyl-tRNA synthetase